MHIHQYSLLLCFSFSHFTQARIFTGPSQLSNQTYDFIIVGGGTAGNVVARRLTETRNTSVLVIEAGGSNEGVISTIIPFLAQYNLPFSEITWNFTTTPQDGLFGRRIPYPRGKILGGSSSINYLTYTRGADDEYDRWARLTQDASWSWENVRQYYFKSSRLVPPPDYHNTTGEVDPSVHGYGPVTVGAVGYRTEMDRNVKASSYELRGQFSYNPDMQSGNTLGLSIVQAMIGNSRRFSSAVAYLEPVLKHSNLDVLINTQVTRLIQTSTSDRGPHFSKVEFAQSRNGPRYNVTANKEIILSAGAIGTPQILMLSGIGNRTELASKGVESVVDLPDVGQNMQDHPLVLNYFEVNSTNTYDQVLRDPLAFNNSYAEWITSGRGWFSIAQSTSTGFVRVNESILHGIPDPSAGLRAGHIELLFSAGFIVSENQLPETGNYITIFASVLNPLSRGAVTLATADPFDYPNINPAFLSNDVDVSVMVEGIRIIRRIVGSSAWDGYIVSRFGELAEAETDQEIADVARRIAGTFWHASCTARVSPVNASWGVLDPDLLVKGISGVRVVDASAFPIIPAVHTTAPVYILAERAVDFVKDFWGFV